MRNLRTSRLTFKQDVEHAPEFRNFKKARIELFQILESKLILYKTLNSARFLRDQTTALERLAERRANTR